MGGDRELFLPSVLGVVVILASLIGVRSLADAQQEVKAGPPDAPPAVERPAVPRQ